MKGKKKKYKHIFFDLDRTLWDFDKSAFQTFEEIFDDYQLKEKGIDSFAEFVSQYRKNNDMLWRYYRRGEIKKEILSLQRWEITLHDFNIDDIELATRISIHYIERSPLKVNLFPYTHEILSYLKDHYYLHVITNGFVEVQQTKLTAGDLRKYFTQIITSEEAGAKKPEKRIFEYALDKTGANLSESLMIGDDIDVDIQGAKNIEMDQLLVNHAGIDHELVPTFEVADLQGLRELL
ncbi:MAG: YjjG family noncanonical pyrimidine nucleotidase [Bacteroidales bacterium]|nr:YjjG family noncanonical pyrimidine nucleotidase [Bacteroidales bacterium]MCF8387122.1 YjjG family noncanonical pyrimidine nucleotidase [Bacteroidales bacterium]MCF8398008.1 YjjG family noncanonical pyrimidine nucleotidase [Bacteroidales bacterium]